MKGRWRLTALGLLVAGTVLALGTSPGMAAPSAHVYLLRGLMNIFSLGMDTLAAELNRRGVNTTVDNHSEWQSLADQAAANYLGARGVPVALVVPFDGTESFSASANVARVLNFTQHYYMGRGPGFHGSLVNVDLRSDPNIDHLTIDKSPRLHARVIAEVLAIVGGHRAAEASEAAKPATVSAPVPVGTTGAINAAPAAGDAVKSEETPAAPDVPATRAKSGAGAMNASDPMKPLADSGTPIIAIPERRPSAKPAPLAAPQSN